jgi:hypothetical protein
VGSLGKRLEQLEARGARRGSRSTPDYLEAYFRALENHERASSGLEPLPYSEVDRRADEHFLRETLPAYKASPGWQTEATRRMLDEWEKDTLERLEKGASR